MEGPGQCLGSGRWPWRDAAGGRLRLGPDALPLTTRLEPGSRPIVSPEAAGFGSAPRAGRGRPWRDDAGICAHGRVSRRGVGQRNGA
jgi:hypothetical protein